MENWITEIDKPLFTFLGFLFSIVASIIGTYLCIKWSLRKRNRPINEILNFGNDELLFIFAHSNRQPWSILPRMATEDFLAINKVMNVLLKIRWKAKTGVRLADRLSRSDKEKNIVSVCSAKINKFSKEIQGLLIRKRIRFYKFQKVRNSDEWQITDGVANYSSKSYEQIRTFLDEGGEVSDLGTQAFEDAAAITKITNPWNARNKIILIAGARGIGTWAAAQCLSDKWQEIYRLLPKGRKNCDFSALIHVKYDNYDIAEIKVYDVLTINSEEIFKTT